MQARSKISKVVVAFFLICCAIPVSASDSLRGDISDVIVFPLQTPRLSSTYGMRRHPIRKIARHHSGVDLAAPKKSHVRSIAEGYVIFSGTLPGYGKTVSIRHSDQHVSLYGHLNSMSVKVGQRIPAGKVIGRVGSTGMATGPHLHFEWRQDGKAINPLKFFPNLTKKPQG